MCFEFVLVLAAVYCLFGLSLGARFGYVLLV